MVISRSVLIVRYLKLLNNDTYRKCQGFFYSTMTLIKMSMQFDMTNDDTFFKRQGSLQWRFLEASL